MNVSEYRVTMVHDGGSVKIIVTASSATSAVDSVVAMERAPRRSARLVETRPLQFERTSENWTPVPDDQWGRVDDQPANVDVHTNPFAPDPRSLCAVLSSQELEDARDAHGDSVPSGITEELSRREDLARAVDLWERLCAVPFVRGETQGEYQYSTRHLDPHHTEMRGGGAVSRMPNREEIEALVLSDGEETAYPAHDVTEPSGYVWRQDSNPWSYGDRLYPITLTLISCGDYHGSDVDAANNRALDGTPGVMVREPNTGGQGSVFNVSTTVVGEMSGFENAKDPGDTEREPAERRADALMWLESLVGQMESLVDNVTFLDESKHSEYLSELADEAWGSWLESDVFSELGELAGSYWDRDEDWHDELDAMREAEPGPVREAYFGFEDNEWTAESATSVVNGRHEDAVKHVARTVFGWSV